MDAVKAFIEQQSFRDYKSLKRLTEPLRTHYGITSFWHYHIGAEKTFFYTGNDPEAMNSYVELNLHRDNPFFSHPDFFPQMRVFCDTIQDDEYQKEYHTMRSKT